MGELLPTPGAEADPTGARVSLVPSMPQVRVLEADEKTLRKRRDHERILERMDRRMNQFEDTIRELEEIHLKPTFSSFSSGVNLFRWWL